MSSCNVHVKASTPRVDLAANGGCLPRMRARVLEVVRGGNDFVIGLLVDDLMATPGFAGVREQVKKLKALFRSEWKRRRPKQVAPALPRQRFVQRLSTMAVAWRHCARQLQTVLMNRVLLRDE